MTLLLFLIIDLLFLVPVFIAQNFICTADFAIPKRIPTKEAKAELKTLPITTETKISKC